MLKKALFFKSLFVGLSIVGCMHSDELPSPVVSVNEENFEKEVLQCELPVIVKFSAPWCGPCKAIKPLYPILCRELDGKAKCVEIELSEQTMELAQKCSVEGVPAHVFYYRGQIVGAIEGAPNVATLEEAKGTFRDLYGRFVQDVQDAEKSSK